jgi:prophage regulatory protein
MREPDRIIRLKTVLARTGLSRSTIYRKIAEGTFPAQLKISTHGTGWHESDLNRWIADPVGWRPKREFDEIRRRVEARGQQRAKCPPLPGDR